MKVRRYKSIFSIAKSPGFIEYDNLPKRKEFDESIADRRYFTPIREQVRSVPAGAISSVVYDFPDGKDNGMKIPISRRRGVDISEVSQAVRKSQESISEKIETAKNFANFKKELESTKPRTKPTEA